MHPRSISTAYCSHDTDICDTWPAPLPTNSDKANTLQIPRSTNRNLYRFIVGSCGPTCSWDPQILRAGWNIGSFRTRSRDSRVFNAMLRATGNTLAGIATPTHTHVTEMLCTTEAVPRRTREVQSLAGRQHLDSREQWEGSPRAHGKGGHCASYTEPLGTARRVWADPLPLRGQQQSFGSAQTKSTTVVRQHLRRCYPIKAGTQSVVVPDNVTELW